jgi:aminopeptidase
MVDERIKTLADILVNYSIKVRRGDAIQLNFGIDAKPLALEVYRLLVKKGALPVTNAILPGFPYIFFKHATTAQLKAFPKISMLEAKNVQGTISIGAQYNIKEFTNIHPDKIALRNKVLHKISEEILRKKNWVGCEYPTHSLAQEAEMSLEEFEEFYFAATLQDWKKIGKQQEKLKRILDKGKKVRIIGGGTDISFSIENRQASNGCGHFNMPDGEVFIAPQEKTAEGTVAFTYPSNRYGTQVDGIRLEFRKGKAVKASATKNEAFLKRMISMDRGASYLGEFGIGTNYGIKRHINNILFDEKIGGTIHLALGMAYKEGGGRNKSALHWDLIKDLRKGGEVWIGNKLIQKNGKFTL